jgi:hypothetical protein
MDIRLFRSLNAKDKLIRIINVIVPLVAILHKNVIVLVIDRAEPTAD